MKSPNYPAVFQQSSLIKTPKNLPSIPSEVKKWKKWFSIDLSLMSCKDAEKYKKIKIHK